MEFTKEFIEENKLSEEQVTAITGHVTNREADIKKEYDGKANTDAEGILNGASTSIADGFGIEREKGEKIKAFIIRVADKRSETLKTEAEQAKADYLEKAKNVKGNEGLTQELDDLKSKYDEAQKKYADYDVLKESAGKHDTLLEKHDTMKLEVSFGQVKPNFPDTVNKYEAIAKWNEFKTELLKTHKIELVDGVPMAIDKENQYKSEKLSDLVEKDKELSTLLEGRKQGGSGATQQKGTLNIDNVPFPVPVDATTKERAETIEKYLVSKNLVKSSSDYAKEFAKFNTLIVAQKNAA